MTRREQVHNELSQRERRQVQRDTMHGRAIAEQDTIGGRYGTISRTRVVGSKPLVDYPAESPGSPWSADPVPAEEPLGYCIDQMEPVGEPHEVAASLLGEAQNGVGLFTLSHPARFANKRRAARSDAGHQPDVIEPGSPLPKRSRRKR